MKKIYTFIIAVFLCITSCFAMEGEITYVKGKVEVQRGSEWVALKPGDKVSKQDVISTGFQSEAKIKLIESILCLGPVTRVTLEDLSAGAKQDKVNVYLKTGQVRSQVNHTESKRVNYQVHTAIAVASARGTDYSVFDSNETFVMEGTVAVAPYVPESQTETIQETSAAAKDTESTEESVAESTEESVPALETQGVLVKTNQATKVSSTGTVAAPENNVVKSVNTVVQAVSTAANKESIRSGVPSVGASVPNTTVQTVAVNPENVLGHLNITITVE